MHFPIIALIDVGQRRRNSALGHYRMRFAKKRFANESNTSTGGRSFNRGAQPRAASANHQHIVLESFLVGHGQKSKRVRSVTKVRRYKDKDLYPYNVFDEPLSA